MVIVPGDIAPAEVTAKAFREVLGEGMPWLPVPGNHEQSRGEAKKMSDHPGRLLQARPALGAGRPAGLQYHFTYRNTQFVGLNIYWNGKLDARGRDRRRQPDRGGAQVGQGVAGRQHRPVQDRVRPSAGLAVRPAPDRPAGCDA